MHIEINDSNNRYYEKIYLSDDRKTYIDLNKNRITYFDKNEEESITKRISPDALWYGVLKCLLEHNSDFVEAADIYKAVYGFDSEDAGEKIKSQVNEIKKKAFYEYTDLDIRQYGDSWKLELPSQEVKIVASKLWITRPFYLDEETITKLAIQQGIQVPEEIEDEIGYKTARLTELSYHKGNPLSVNEIGSVPASDLVTIKGAFKLLDVYVGKKNFRDFENPMELMQYDEEDITLSMSSMNGDNEVYMFIGGQNLYFRMRHLIQIVSATDKIFDFQILGFIDKIGDSKYSMKPISIVYI